VKISLKDPPRVFEVGIGKPISLKDYGRIELAPDEQLTFVTEAGAEYDVVRKTWGFYATPSLNGRLAQFGLQAILIKNRLQRYFVVLVERGREPQFAEYLAEEGLSVIQQLNTTEALQELEPKLHAE
jgi:hypothetical protein